MAYPRLRAYRRSVPAALVSSAMLAGILVGVGQSPAFAAVTSVRGSACGYYVNVGLFGGPQMLRGCGQAVDPSDEGFSPSVALPSPGGSATAVTANKAAGARAVYGPAAIFAGKWPESQAQPPPSGPISVSTQGTPGTQVTSSVDIVLRTPANPVSPGGFGPGPVEGNELHASCSASETSVTGSTRFVGGLLTTSTTPDGSPLAQEPIPDNPPPNYTRSGVITNVGDVFTVVFNQQIVNADGSLTVNAFHMYLFGPVAVGESVGGQVTCGTTPSAIAPNDTVAPTCGTPVVQPNGPTDPTPMSPRTELVGTFDAGGLQSITNAQATNGTVQLGVPSSQHNYLHFVPGQTGPLPVTATRTAQAEAAGLPMTWSFNATDVAGNATHCHGVIDDSGLLRVTTSPALPSQILVDGIPRDSFGLNWVKIAPGQHTVSFTHVEGWTEPLPQTVTVSTGATTTVTGTFTRRGMLHVVTAPAVPGTISVDGIPRNQWGIWTDLPTGQHQVCFGPVAGYNPPGCQGVNLTAGAETLVTGAYTVNPAAPGPTNFGELRVTSSPAVPTQIVVDGIPRDTWGLTWLKVPPGSYTVSFTHVEGWTEPAPTTVTVAAGATTPVTGTFAQRGALEVKTNPAWPGTVSVDGIPRDDWGMWTDLPAGAHQVCFGPVPGSTAPPCQVANLVAGQKTTVTGTYT